MLPYRKLNAGEQCTDLNLETSPPGVAPGGAAPKIVFTFSKTILGADRVTEPQG